MNTINNSVQILTKTLPSFQDFNFSSEECLGRGFGELLSGRFTLIFYAISTFLKIFSWLQFFKFQQMGGLGDAYLRDSSNSFYDFSFFTQYNQFQGLKEMFPSGEGDMNPFFTDFGQAYFPNWNPSFSVQLERDGWNQVNHNLGSQPYYQPNYQYSNYYYVAPQEDLSPNKQNIAGSPAPHRLSIDQVPVKEEYQPEMTPEADREDRLGAVQEKWRQKYGRNIMSNIFHMTLKKITSRQFSEHAKEAILRHRLVITVKEFASKVEEKGMLTNSYISSKNMKKLLVGNPIGATKIDIDFRKLLRVLAGIYLHYEHIPHIYHSGKIKKESRRLHLQSLRKLMKRLNKL